MIICNILALYLLLDVTKKLIIRKKMNCLSQITRIIDKLINWKRWLGVWFNRQGPEKLLMVILNILHEFGQNDNVLLSFSFLSKNCGSDGAPFLIP